MEYGLRGNERPFLLHDGQTKEEFSSSSFLFLAGLGISLAMMSSSNFCRVVFRRFLRMANFWCVDEDFFRRPNESICYGNIVHRSLCSGLHLQLVFLLCVLLRLSTHNIIIYNTLSAPSRSTKQLELCARPLELVSSNLKSPPGQLWSMVLGSVCMLVSSFLCGGLRERNGLSGDIRIFLNSSP